MRLASGEVTRQTQKAEALKKVAEMSQEVTGVNGNEQDAVIADLQKERDLLKDDVDKMKDRFQVSHFFFSEEK